MTRSGEQSFAQQIFASDRAIGEIDVGGVIDDAAIDLLRNALIEAPVAGFHVEDRNLATLRRNDREAAVGVAEHQARIGLLLGEHRGRSAMMTLPMVCAALAAALSRK